MLDVGNVCESVRMEVLAQTKGLASPPKACPRQSAVPFVDDHTSRIKNRHPPIWLPRRLHRPLDTLHT